MASPENNDLADNLKGTDKDFGETPKLNQEQCANETGIEDKITGRGFISEINIECKEKERIKSLQKPSNIRQNAPAPSSRTPEWRRKDYKYEYATKPQTKETKSQSKRYNLMNEVPGSFRDHFLPQYRCKEDSKPDHKTIPQTKGIKSQSEKNNLMNEVPRKFRDHFLPQYGCKEDAKADHEPKSRTKYNYQNSTVAENRSDLEAGPLEGYFEFLYNSEEEENYVWTTVQKLYNEKPDLFSRVPFNYKKIRCFVNDSDDIQTIVRVGRILRNSLTYYPFVFCLVSCRHGKLMFAVDDGDIYYQRHFKGEFKFLN